MRRALNISGLNVSSVLPGPAIRIKPKMTMIIPMVSKIKLVLPNAKFLLSIILFFITFHEVRWLSSLKIY